MSHTLKGYGSVVNINSCLLNFGRMGYERLREANVKLAGAAYIESAVGRLRVFGCPLRVESAPSRATTTGQESPLARRQMPDLRGQARRARSPRCSYRSGCR